MLGDRPVSSDLTVEVGEVKNMTARRTILMSVAALVVLLLAASWIVADGLASPRVASADESASSCPLASPADAPPPTVNGRRPRLARICFVPLGEPKTLDLAGLASHYQERFGVTVGVLPPVRAGMSEYNLLRQQFVGERLIDLMRRSYPVFDADPATLLIGFTEVDLYLEAMPSWYWAFAQRTEGRFAVISTAHMDPYFYALEPDPELLNTRARKITTKTIGLLYFGLPLSKNPKSVLYDSILGVDDLDAVGEEL
jgi:predicted Zn-dependent protease